MTQATGRHEPRVRALDGLRGVAAVIVVLSHSFNALTLSPEVRGAITHSPLALLLSSAGAVHLFFVLSGYVLSASLSRASDRRATTRFLIRRVFRIHPPYLFALYLAWFASFYYVAAPPEFAQGFSPVSARIHLTLPELLMSSLFPGKADGQLPVGWTLGVEMTFSLLLPMMFLAARKTHWSLLLVGSAIILAVASTPKPFGYSLDFSLGISAFLERDRLSAWLSRLPSLAAALWIGLALSIFAAPQALWPVATRGILVTIETPLNIAVLGLGSVALVISAATLPMLSRPLSWRPMLYLGRISFSMYLVHYTLILLLSPIVERPTPLPSAVLFLALVLGSSILVSTAAYRWVEQPSIRLGEIVSAPWHDREE